MPHDDTAPVKTGEIYYQVAARLAHESAHKAAKTAKHALILAAGSLFISALTVISYLIR